MNESSKISLMVPASVPNAADDLRKYADGKDWVEYALLTSIAARIDWLEARNTKPASANVSATVSYLAIQRLMTAAQALYDAEIARDHSSGDLKNLRGAMENAKKVLSLG
jgi:hypothetical protein